MRERKRDAISDRAKELRTRGMTYKEIAKELNASVTMIRVICVDSGLDGTYSTQVQTDAMRRYKAEGHSIPEVARHFGCAKSTAQRACRGMKPVFRQSQNKYVKATETERKEYVERFLPDGFSYVGGYVDCEHDVKLRCDKCGNVFERSMNTLRNKNTRTVFCDACEEAKRTQAKEEARKQKEVDRFARKMKRKAELETERFMKTILVECIECGKIFSTTNSRKVCCSSKCSHRRANRKHDRRLTKDKIIDNVTVNELFKRDKGRCWICGGLCDKSDFMMKGNAFIAGNNYPSIDHIVPVCMGGADAWENVRLAHRICNTKRYFDEKLQPPISAVTA